MSASNEDKILPWKTKDWWVSHYNYDPEVIEGTFFQERIEIHDVTLRDGEQTPGVVFTKEDKIAIARLLDQAQVPRIEAGMPVVSEDDRQAIKAIAKEVLQSRVFAFCRLKKEDIDASIDCDVGGVVIEIPALNERLDMIGMSIDVASERAIDLIQYAKDHGLFVVFFPFDTSRADFESVAKLVSAGEEAGADRVAVVDTVGGCSPDGYAALVNKVRKTVSIPIECHCHNHLGLGTANTLAGLAAGASAAHVTVNGIGEAGGNVALEEVVMSLRLLRGIDLNIDMKVLSELSKLVSELSGINVPVNKPVFGRNLFTKESGIVLERYFKAPALAKRLELFDPNLVGQNIEILLGKKSGKYSILYILREMGLKASDAQVAELVSRVKDISINKKGPVTEKEFHDLLSQTIDDFVLS